MYNAQYTHQYTTVYKQYTRAHTKLWETLHSWSFFKVNLRRPNTYERLSISHSIQNSMPLCLDKSAGKDKTKSTIQ